MMRLAFKLIFVISLLHLYIIPDLCRAHDTEKPSVFFNLLTKEEQQWLKAHPVIRLGTAPDRPPFEFIDDRGQSQGMVADYLELIAKRLQVTFKRMEKEDGSPLSWAQILKAAQNRQLDCVSCLMKTKERSSYLAFTRPYLDFPFVLVVNRNNDTAGKISDFNGQKFAVLDAYPISKQLRTQYPKLIYVPVETPLQGLQAVALGRVAGYVVNAADASYHIKKHSLKQLKIAAALENIDTQLRMGVRKDWPVLAEILDKAFASLTPRETTAIHNRWISLDYEKKMAWHEVLTVAAPALLIFLVIFGVVLMVNRKLKKEIVKRQQTEKLLLKSEERLHFALDAANAHHWQIDMQSREITYSSLQLFVSAGYSEQEAPLTLNHYLSLVHPDDIALLDEAVQQFLAGEKTLKKDYRLRHKQSGWIWIHSVGQAVEWDARGQVIKLAGITMDITERQTLHQQIKASREQLRIISEHTHDWQSWRDLDGKLLWVNQAVEKVTGYTVAECMEMEDYPFQIYDKRDWAIYKKVTDAALKGKGRQEAQIRVRRKDGSQVWVSSAYEPVLDKNGQIIGLAGAAKDITKQIKAEQGLRLLSKVFEDSSDPILISDLSGNIMDLNEATIEAYGYSREELLGKYIGIFASEEADIKGSEALYQRCIKGEVLKNIEGTRVRKDGTVLPHLFTYSLLKDDKCKHLGIASIAKDITWIKEAEKELEDYRDHLEELVKERTLDLEEARQVAEEATKAKSNFLANMSHEIRTPLNAIIGFAHLALQTELDSRQHDYIHKIQNGSKALLGVIDDILDFSKIEAGKLSMESIEFLLEDVLETVTNLVGIKAQEKGLEVIYNIDPNIPHSLIGDPIRLGQILLNLTNNAVKFTKEGEIVLGCTLLGEDADEARLEFYVQDSGIGLTKEQKDKLFQAFSQADATTTRKYGGTGLGLFISKSLVEMMNGHIRVESEYGQGTTFFFTVRLKRVGSQTIASRFAVPDMQKKKILVVDDNDISRTVLEKMLTAMSFKVIQADSTDAGLAELEMARKHGEPFDLVLMDGQMPGIDGRQASEKIKTALEEKTPSVIMVSAYAREEMMQKADRLGLDRYLIKPVSPSLLFDSIMTVLGKKLHPRAFQQQKEQLRVTEIQGAKLLLAEDNEVNQQVARGILENNGFIVDLADNGVLAIEAVQKTRYDAVLMDINMPEMDGYTASREIRQLPGFKDLPIIAMTANAMAGDREKALAAGMNDHVTKPIDVKELLNALRTWVKPVRKKSGQEKETLPNKAVDNGELSENWGPLPGINIQDGLDRLIGDTLLYRDLLKKFARNQAQTADKIQQALITKDMETAQRLAHTIKGVSGNISATLVFESATRLDEALRNKDIQTAMTLLPDFAASLSEVIQGINRLETGKEGRKQRQDGPAPDPEALRPQLITLQEMLDENDIKAISMAGQIRDQIPENSMEGLVDQLIREIGEYDFDEAQNTLQQLCREMGLD